MASKELQSPSEMALITPGVEQPPDFVGFESSNRTDATDAPKNEKVQMKKQLGLLEGVAIILGIIFGSGIFISPKGVIREVDAVGTSLLIWVLSGLLSMIGALCYAELGTAIPKSGGDYAYIYEAFGSLPAFLYLWDAMMIFVRWRVRSSVRITMASKEIDSTAQPSGSSHNRSDAEPKNIHMQRHLGLLEGVAIIMGIILGSGIFISPKGVLQEVEAVGTSLLVWVLCGILSMIGALCYAELGTAIPKSGGDYAYIYEAFGSLPAFLYLWDAMMIFVPTTNAIMGLTFASYVLQPFFSEECKIPEGALQLLAAVTICFLTFLNSYNMKATTKMQNVIMFTKIAALVLIIVLGIVWMAMGNVENFDKPFENSQVDPGKLSVAFYSGIFSYAGWNYLNFMTEELRDPYKNLPRAIYISLPLVTAIYVLANLSYLAVLTPQQMIASEAIAVTFGNKVLGVWSIIIPIMVAISAFGGLSVHIMTSSRMCFVGARNGHMPALLSHININKYTPTPSLVFLCALSIVMLLVSDVYVLITYSSIVESFFIMLSVSAVLWFRYKRPNMERPIKVQLWVPIVFVIICAFLIVVPCYVAPYEVGMGLLITAIGVPFYYAGIVWRNKPIWLQNIIAQLTYTFQKIFMSAKEDKD